MFFKRSSTDWVIPPESALADFEPPKQSIPRVESEDHEWIDAIKGGSAPLSNFELSGPFTEVVLLGNLAVRLGKEVKWDGAALKATNAPEADSLINQVYRKGWEL